MDEQGLAGTLLFPTLGVGIEDALEHDPEACTKVFEAFNRWLDDDWGYRHERRISRSPTSRSSIRPPRPPSWHA